MLHSKKKTMLNLLTMLLLICVLAAAVVWYSSTKGNQDSDSKTDLKMEGIRLTMANLSAAQIQADLDFAQQLKDNLGLLSLPLRSIVAQEEDSAIQNYAYGCVLRRDGDRFILPEDTAALPLLEPQEYEGAMPYTPAECDPFLDYEGAFWSRLPKTKESKENQDEEKEESDYVLCAYRRLTGDYYYLYYIPLSGVEAFYQTRFDTVSVLTSAETVYDGYFAAWIEAGDELTPFYKSSIFEGRDQPSDLGISIGSEKSGFRPMTYEDTRYMYAVSAPMWVTSVGGQIRIAYFTPQENYVGSTYGHSIIVLVIAVTFFLALTIWVLAAKEVMNREAITQSRRRHYGARRMRVVAASLGAVGLIMILLINMFAQALSDIYYGTTACQSALDTLNSMASENGDHEKRLTAQRNDQYLSYAQRIATLLGLYPELKTVDQLAEMSETIEADYLMLYDDRGKEILSNSPYVGLTYGEDETSSTYDFRRLIAGVPSIIHEACVDEVTGLSRQLIGVSMDDGNIANGYGSLIMAVKPRDADEDFLSTGDIMRSLATTDGVIFAVSKESKSIDYASAPALVGKNVLDLGMKEGDLHEGFMDFFTLDGQDRYGCCVEKNGYLYYSAVRTSSLFKNIFMNSLIPALMFLVAYGLLAAVLLAGYTEKNIDASGIRVIDDHDWAYRESEREEMERRSGWWARKTPEGKVGFVLMTLVAVGILALMGTYLAGGMRGGNMAIIPYVLSGRWTRGLNLFAAARIVILIGGVVLVLIAMKALLNVLCNILETRGETILRLSFSLLRYVVIIVGLFFCLEALGVDTTTLLASLGIFSLAISLGAKDMVADVLSGILIVFSGEYQIGDIVEIAGFRGRVWEIGVRSTVIVNNDGNMKNISNRNVSNVMNLSRLNSRYNMQVAIAYDQPLDKIREMLARELPAIDREFSDIANGPVFVGVTGREAGSLTLGFYAECAEEDMAKVRDMMNRAIKALFEKHGIPIK